MRLLLAFLLLSNPILRIGQCFAGGPEAAEIVEEPSSHVLQRVLGKPLAELQGQVLKIDPGKILNVEDGNLVLSSLTPETKSQLDLFFEDMRAKITGVLHAQKLSDVRDIREIRIEEAEGITLKGKELRLGRVILSSSQCIKIRCIALNLAQCMAEVTPLFNTLVIEPHNTLNSPIESIRITPQQTPVFMEGTIDFRTHSFNNFLISDSIIEVYFK